MAAWQASLAACSYLPAVVVMQSGTSASLQLADQVSTTTGSTELRTWTWTWLPSAVPGPPGSLRPSYRNRPGSEPGSAGPSELPSFIGAAHSLTSGQMRMRADARQVPPAAYPLVGGVLLRLWRAPPGSAPAQY